MIRGNCVLGTKELMHPVIEQLLVIQDLDRRLVQLRREKQDVPERIAVIEARLHAHRESLKSAQEEAKKMSAAMKQIEVEIEAAKQKIQRFREQEMQIKNNEEYRALEHEIVEVQKAIRKMEDQELDLMEKMEALKATVKNRENDLQQEERRVEEDKALLQKRADVVSAEIADLERKRSGLAQNVDATWLARYEKVFRRWGDFAVVPVENGACGGCHMKLTPQIVHDARKAEGVVICSYCNRMLYVAP
jgi:predicted  nucleic acid-binding Zn-ribbon protein